MRRKFYELYVGGNQPIATQALARIKKLYEIEAEIRGRPAELRRALRQEKARPLVEALKPWLEESLAKVSKGSKLAEALAYGLNHWGGLCRYLEDGRIEIDSNTVERSIRPLALTRKNALFAGHDMGAASWATAATLIETCLCRARHRHVYTARRTIPSGADSTQHLSRFVRSRFGIVHPLALHASSEEGRRIKSCSAASAAISGVRAKRSVRRIDRLRGRCHV